MIGIGTHLVEVVKHSVRMIQRTGTKYISITFKDPTSNEQIEGAIWLTRKALNQARRSLEALGFDVDNSELQILQDQPIFLAGRRAEIVVEMETWNGQERAKVRWINRPPIDAAKQKAELTVIGQQLRDSKPSGSEAPKEEEHPLEPNEVELEGDVPF